MLEPSNPRVNEVLRKYNQAELKDGCTYFELLRRPEVKYSDIKYIAEGAGLDLGEECPKDTSISRGSS